MPFSFIFFGCILLITNFNQDLKKSQKCLYSIFFAMILIAHLFNYQLTIKNLSLNIILIGCYFSSIFYFRKSLNFNKKVVYFLPVFIAIVYLLVLNLNPKFSVEFQGLFVGLVLAIVNIFNFKNLKSLVYGLLIGFLYIEIADCYFFVMDFEFANVMDLSFFNIFSISLCLDLILFYGYKILNKYSKKQKRVSL